MEHDIHIPDEVVAKWQDAVDVLAEVAAVPAALIMRVLPDEIEVFRSSQSAGNPYDTGERAPYHRECGLYCETVARTKQRLLIPDALADPEWASNPDVELGMISYLGYPLLYPDGTPFGTICILDSKANPYTPQITRLMEQFRGIAETHLELLVKNLQLAEEIELREKLEGALIRTERMRALGTAAAGIAHTYNNAMTGVIGHLDIIARDPDLKPAVRDTIDRVLGLATRIVAVTDSLRGLARHESRDKIAVGLDRIVHETLPLVAAELEAAGVEVKLQLEAPCPAEVNIGELSQVVLCLLDNSKHALVDRPGGHIEIATGSQGDRAFLRVTDNGCGISAEYLDDVVLPFFTKKGEHAEPGSPLEKSRGIGLGLSLSDRIVENHQGRLEISSEPGAGTSVTLWLPRPEGCDS